MWTLAEIAQHVDGVIIGDAACKISNVSTLLAANKQQISFLANTKYKKYLEGLKKATLTKATSSAKPLVSKAVSTAKATKYGKIALGVAGVGLAAKAYIKKKMDKSNENPYVKFCD